MKPMDDSPPSGRTIDRVKMILRRDLKLGDGAEIPDDTPLSAGNYDIDSLDILLLVTSLEKEFEIRIPDESASRAVFASAAMLASFVDARRVESGSQNGDDDR